MLRTKLFKAFAVLVILFGLMTIAVGIHIINSRLLDEAQTRVRLNLSSAWAIYNFHLQKIETVLKLVSSKKYVVDTVVEGLTNDSGLQELQNRLEHIRVTFNFDFLGVVSPEGQVLVRATPPYNAGDYKISDPAVRRALKGQPAVGVGVYGSHEMEREAESLADQAFTVFDQTPHSRPALKPEETRGMVMLGAFPVTRGSQVIGAIYGGMLVNRNQQIVDNISEVVFKNETYRNKPIGTVTVFLNDCRIATTVKLDNGNRAIGTRVSREVAERVLDNGKSWLGRAFVVNDWYLTAYDPVRDMDGKVIGMLYVGILEKPFRDLRRNVIWRFAGLMIIGLVAAMVFAFVYSARLASPIHRLVQAVNEMEQGRHPGVVATESYCEEIRRLIMAFNNMAGSLTEREGKLKEANESLRVLNRNYMETLGFVAHELKGPVATVMNYTFLMKEQKLGPLTEKQTKALANIDANIKHLIEMIRHYLDLSRIENNELQPVMTKVSVRNDVLKIILDSYETEFQRRSMKVFNEVGADLAIRADLNMTREIFENLLINALKYGRDGGAITITGTVEGNLAVFKVRNEGEGIARDKLKNLFQKFVRLNGTEQERAQKGTGLGLFITKTIVEAHGGTITVDSEQGAWTEISFTLPARREA